MKIILAILLAQCVAFGQTNPDAVIRKAEQAFHARYNMPDGTVNWFAPNKFEWIRMWISLYNTNQNQPHSCADSLIVWLEGYETSTFRVEFDTTTDILNRSPYGRIYKKDESTLSGFMDWLKRRKH